MKTHHISLGACLLGITLSSISLTEAAVVVASGFTPVVVSSGPLGIDFNLNPGSGPTEDSIADFRIIVNDFGSVEILTVLGLGTNTIAVVAPAAAPFPAIQFQPGDTIGSSETYAGSQTASENSQLAFELAGGGAWDGGDTGYIGIAFDISGSTHYGFARITWSPDTPGSSDQTAFATVEQIGYETVAGDAVVIPIPEPSSTSLLSLLAGLAILRRRRV